MLAEAAQQLSRGALLRRRETSRHRTQPVDVGGKHLVHQRPPFRSEFAEDDPLILGGRSPPHQSTLFELLDHVSCKGCRSPTLSVRARGRALWK